MRLEYKILLTTSLLANFSDNLIGPFYAVFVKGIGGSILDIGYTVAVYGICSGILMILTGKISDRFNKTAITVLGYSLFALGTLGYLFVRTPLQLFGLQIIFAIGMACLSAPLNALYARYIQRKNEGWQWSLGSGGTQIVVGLAVLAGTLLVNRFGFTVLFLTMFALQAITTLIQLKLFLMTRCKGDISTPLIGPL